MAPLSWELLTRDPGKKMMHLSTGPFPSRVVSEDHRDGEQTQTVFHVFLLLAAKVPDLSFPVTRSLFFLYANVILHLLLHTDSRIGTHRTSSRMEERINRFLSLF